MGAPQLALKREKDILEKTRDLKGARCRAGNLALGLSVPIRMNKSLNIPIFGVDLEQNQLQSLRAAAASGASLHSVN